MAKTPAITGLSPLTTPLTRPSLACAPHDHSLCVEAALTNASKHCEQRGTRLTELRAQVLRLVWQSHKPLGAYTLMEMLAQESTRRVAPPTVYRALDFLLEEGLIHRINSLNAFIGCPSIDHQHSSHFLICETCKIALELDAPDITQLLEQSASRAGFSLRTHNIELLGLCPNCAKAAETNQGIPL